MQPDHFTQVTAAEASTWSTPPSIWGRAWRRNPTSWWAVVFFLLGECTNFGAELAPGSLHQHQSIHWCIHLSYCDHRHVVDLFWLVDGEFWTGLKVSALRFCSMAGHLHAVVLLRSLCLRTSRDHPWQGGGWQQLPKKSLQVFNLLICCWFDVVFCFLVRTHRGSMMRLRPKFRFWGFRARSC